MSTERGAANARAADPRATAAIVGAGIAVALNIGKLPPALPLLRDEFGMTLVQASFLVSMFQVAGMMLGLFGGMLADRFGPRRVMRSGIATIAVGAAIGALTTDASVLLASRAVESAGFILTVLPGPALLARRVSAVRLRWVMGIWAAYMPTGTATALVLAPVGFAAFGWRPVWLAIALLCAGWALLLGRVLPPDDRHGMPASAIALVRDTLASPRPWLLALTFGFYAAQWIAVISFLPTLYLEAGIALTLAGPLTALAAAANVIGTIGSGALLQRGFTRATLVAAASATMFVCAWIAFGTDAPLAVRYAAVFAFSAGGGLIPGTLFATTLAYAPYPQAVSTTTGLMQQGAAIGQFIGPPLVAAVASASGHWGNTWLVTGALAAICLALALAIARTDRRLALCARAERSAHGSRTG